MFLLNGELGKTLDQVPFFIESLAIKNVDEYPNKDWDLSLIYKRMNESYIKQYE